jgi:hypothetical protein
MPACPVLQSLSHLTMFETLQHACVSQWMHLKHATIVKVLPCLQALSPHYGYYYFRNNHHLGWVQCSGLFLAITGDCHSLSLLASSPLFSSFQSSPACCLTVICAEAATGLSVCHPQGLRRLTLTWVTSLDQPSG